MSVNFSTIQPMSQATISRMPSYSTESQPTASVPMNGTQAPKKKSRWFLKTLVAAAAVATAAALLRGKVNVFKNFDVTSTLQQGASFMDKAKFYGTKAVAVAGDFVTNYWNKGVAFVKGLFNRGAQPPTP